MTNQEKLQIREEMLTALKFAVQTHGKANPDFDDIHEEDASARHFPAKNLQDMEDEHYGRLHAVWVQFLEWAAARYGERFPKAKRLTINFLPHELFDAFPTVGSVLDYFHAQVTRLIEEGENKK